MSAETKVSHTELVLAARTAADNGLSTAVRNRKALLKDMEVAYGNLEKNFPGAPRNHQLAYNLAHVVMPERSRREAHFYRYRLMTRAAMFGTLLDPGENLPEVSLLDIEKRTSVMSDEDWAHAATYTGKGISAELGHVDQLGDWNAGHELDDAVRMLPKSDALADAGFLFGETYDRKDTARISYEFYISDGGLKAKRKRAAADVITESGTVYNLVKSSIFLIDEPELQRAEQRVVRDVKRSFKEGEMTLAEVQAQDAIFAAAGEAIIEPFISEKDRREQSTAVLAATSLYFALVRHR